MRVWPDDAATQLEANAQAAFGAESGCDGMVRAQDGVISDRALQGQAYDALRDRLGSYDRVYVYDFRSFCSTLGSLYRAHAGMLGGFFPGESYVSDADIYDQMRDIDAQIADWEEYGALFTLLTPVVLLYFSYLKGKLQQKLDALSDYGAKSASHYDEASALAEALRRGARQVGSMSWQGGSWASSDNAGDLGWPSDFAAASALAQQRLVDLARPGVYRDTAGEYGGNQAGPSTYINSPSLRADLLKLVLSQYPAFSGFGKDEINTLLNNVNSYGCGYTAFVNTIVEHYYFRQEDFERDFGFPLFKDDGSVNFDYLVVDVFCAYTQYRIENNDKNALNDPQGLRLADREDFLNSYLATNTGARASVSVGVSAYDATTDYAALMAKETLVLYAVSNSFYVPVDQSGRLSTQPLPLQHGIDSSGKVFTNPTAHDTVITDVSYDANGNPVLIVSSWGDSYYPQDIGNQNEAYFSSATGRFYPSPNAAVNAGDIADIETQTSVISIEWDE